MRALWAGRGQPECLDGRQAAVQLRAASFSLSSGPRAGEGDTDSQSVGSRCPSVPAARGGRLCTPPGSSGLCSEGPGPASTLALGHSRWAVHLELGVVVGVAGFANQPFRRLAAWGPDAVGAVGVCWELFVFLAAAPPMGCFF